MLIYRESNTTNETGQVKIPSWEEADQLAMYKCSRGVEPGSASGQSGTELGITRFQVQCANHSVMQPPLHGIISYHRIKICPMPELLVLCAMGRFSGKMVRSLTCILIGCIFYRELQMNTRTHPPAHLFPFLFRLLK